MIPITERRVLDHGVIALTEVWGSDFAPARTARTSFRNSDADKTEADNIGLTNYLMKNRHDTPFEFCGATIYMVLPIFVARQWVRHRTAAINEESLRYVEAREQFYIPTTDRMQKQSQTNKQGSSPETVDNPTLCRSIIQNHNEDAWRRYQGLLGAGLAKELARMVLPLNTYTAWYWTANLRNIMHLLGLRLDPHAQYEVRVYAEALYNMLNEIFPNILGAYDQFRRQEKSL